jgi:protein-S-isoprenylcysteine O-methyltransferase Ste14
MATPILTPAWPEQQRPTTGKGNTMTNAIKRTEASPPAREKGARVFPIPPPLYYGAAFAGGMFLHGAVPLQVPGRPATGLAGAALLMAGLVLDVAGVAAIIAHRTTIVPHRPVSTMITTGIYRFSRNPMYTGLALIVAGGALLAGTWWPLFFLPFALLAVHQLAIRPEEIYLGERYGPVYADYRRKVRRWL